MTNDPNDEADEFEPGAHIDRVYVCEHDDHRDIEALIGEPCEDNLPIDEVEDEDEDDDA